jgi:hypothetical protein
VRPLVRPPIAAINSLAAAVDARFSILRGVGPGTLTANFHVVADKPR